MTDEAGAAPAAAEPIAAPAETSQPAQEAAPVIERSKEPARASIDRAFAELDKAEAKSTTTKEPVTASTDTRERDESGRFKPKDAPAIAPEAQAVAEVAKAPTEKPAAIASEPPARFSADAKAAWATAPEPVKAEVSRAIKELETGIQQHQAVLEPLKPWINMAKQHGTTVHDAMVRYTGLEKALKAGDPQQKLQALEDVFETAGISPREYAAHIMGQPADRVASQSDATIRELRQELAAVKQQIGGVTTSIQQRHEAEVKAQVETFAREHPRLNEQEFGQTVARLLESKMADNLQGAYEMAERLNPAPVVDAPPAAPAASTKPTDQTRKASLSIAGAPASGSNPVNRKAPATARESLDRAFASLSLG